VSWLQALPALGVRPETTVLPNQTTCPQCREPQLYLYHDPTRDSEWFYCKACRSRGDMVELASQTWGLDIESTLLKFASTGLSLEINSALVAKYESQYVTSQQNAWKFWERCQENIRSSTNATVRRLQRQFDFSPTNQLLWPDRGSQFVGCAYREDLYLLRNARAGKTAKRKDVIYLFMGNSAGWTDSLVLPFYDLPGRLSGFLLAGREGDPKNRDLVYFTATADQSRHPMVDGGVTMLETLDAPPDRRLGDSVFVFTDPLTAARLQLNWLREHSRPLPILGTYQDARIQPIAVWTELGTYDYIFCAPKAETHVLAQAARAGGRVATNRTARLSLSTYARNNSTLQFLRRLQKAARPWQDVVTDELRRRPATEAESLLRKLRLSDDVLQHFIASCDEQLQNRVQDLYERGSLSRRVTANNRTVVENSMGWSATVGGRDRSRNTRTAELISDVVVRIDQCIATTTGRAYYRGRLLYKGHEYPFLEQTKELDRDLLRWAQSYMRKKGYGEPIFVQSWGKHAITIAKKFHPPTAIRGIERVGWDAAERLFAFPSFTIHSKGGVDTTRTVLPTGDKVPAQNLEAAERLARRDVLLLSREQDVMATYWAVAVGILYNVVAPALLMEPHGLALCGQAAQRTGTLAAQLLGCVWHDARATVSDKGREGLLAVCERHGWPTLFTGSAQSLAPWLTQTSRHGYIAPVDELGGLVLRTTPDWFVLQAEREATELQELAAGSKQLLPAYLADLASRRLALPAGSAINALFDDVSAWFDRLGGDTAPIQQARQRLTPSTKPWRPFIELTARLVHQGHLEYLHQGFELAARREVAVVYDQDSQTLWIPQLGLNRLLQRHDSPVLATERITKLLGKHLVREDYYRGELGWLVDAAWWQRQFRKYDFDGKPKLKIAE